jgi:hypothetical protein
VLLDRALLRLVGGQAGCICGFLLSGWHAGLGWQLGELGIVCGVYGCAESEE